MKGAGGVGAVREPPDLFFSVARTSPRAYRAASNPRCSPSCPRL